MKWIALTLLISSPALAAPSPAAFAYGVELAPLSTQPFHRYPLPDSVLRMLVSRDLGDLCLFDAGGAPRAHAIVWPAAPAPNTDAVELAIFPLLFSGEITGTEVRVERDANGQILRTLSQPLPGNHVGGYLLDAHALDGALIGLDLSTAGDESMLPVRIEASLDLTSFHELARATIANLHHDGRTLSRSAVSFAATRPAYLRVSFDAAHVTLEKATAHLQHAAAPLPRASIELDAMPGEAEPKAEQEFRYLVPHGLRAERYSVLLPAGTSLIQGSLYGADAEDAPLLALDRQVYRTPPTSYPLAESRARVLELRVDDVAGGVRAGAPKLRIEYLAPEVVFAGDGKPPFTLAYGSAEARCTPVAGDALSLEAPRRASVRATETRPLGGPSLLTQDHGAKSLRVYALWASLLIAVAVLGVLARRLLRNV
jgi:hypothetical protein